MFSSSPDQSDRSLDDESIPTYATIRPKYHQAFLGQCRRILGYEAAPRSLRDDMLYSFLNIPKLHLREVKGAASSRQREKHDKRQLAGDIQEQNRIVTKPVTPANADVQRTIATVKRHLRDGFVGKAAKACLREPPIKLAFKILVDGLINLHPKEDTPHDELRIRNPDGSDLGPTYPHIDPSVVASALAKGCSGAAAGRTGWTEELLLVVARDTVLARDFAALVCDIINNDISERNRDRLTSCRLNALPKPKKEEEAEHGIRPIAVGEALLKAACTVVIQDIDPAIKKVFEGIQYGVGAKGGTDFVVHSIWRNITFRKRKITVALDGKNAFNSPFRKQIREVLLRSEFYELRPLWNLWNLAYSKPSNLHFRGDDGETETILSQRGTRQGDVLGGLFFSIAIQPTLTAAKKAFPEIDILAYLDDITLQGDDPDAMKNCIKFIEGEFKVLGMLLNPEKCEWFSEECLCPFAEWLKPKQYIKILGSFFADMQALADAVTAHSKKKHRLFFDRLAILPFNAQIVILSNCGIPRMNYTVRAQHPDLTREACEDFDRRVEACWSLLALVECGDAASRAREVTHELVCRIQPQAERC